MADRPNILMLLSDQHSKRVMRCAGDSVVRTPHLDALAASGVRFSNTYCGSPLCVPSRMTMMAARHCSEIDVWTNACYLASDVPTFAHSLGAGGYETVLAGRMHFMGPDQRHGFHRRIIGDVSGYTHPGALGPRFDNIPPGSCGQSRIAVEVAGPGRTTYQAYDEAVTAATCDFLQTRAAAADERPFMMVSGFVLPHCPFLAPKALYDYYYERVLMPEMPEDYFATMPPAMQKWRQVRGVHDLTAEEIRAARAGYYGLVEFFDGLIGQIMQSLHEAGLAENTIVVYASDHGESAGQNGLWWKSSFYEDAVGVPLIFSAPGRLPEGLQRDEVTSLLDLGPTLADLGDAPPMPATAGRSLRPLLREGPADDWPDEALSELIGQGEDYIPGRMIRQGPWKLTHYEGYEPTLFNLDEDPREFVDRAADPDCRTIRDYLHDRVRQGWDPHRALKRLERHQRDIGLIHRWRGAWTDAPEDPNFWATPADANLWPED
jgi:choline-sulfatase